LNPPSNQDFSPPPRPPPKEKTSQIWTRKIKIPQKYIVKNKSLGKSTSLASLF